MYILFLHWGLFVWPFIIITISNRFPGLEHQTLKPMTQIGKVTKTKNPLGKDLLKIHLLSWLGVRWADKR